MIEQVGSVGTYQINFKLQKNLTNSNNLNLS